MYAREVHYHGSLEGWVMDWQEWRAALFSSLIAIGLGILLASCGTAPLADSDVQTTGPASTAVSSESTTPSSESTTLPVESSTIPERYAGRLVSPAAIDEPALARVVAGLLGRDVPVVGADVVSTSPLKIAITVPGDSEGQDLWFASPQLEREAAAEWVRAGRLSEFEFRVQKPSGETQPVESIPLPAGIDITPEVVPAPTLDLTASRRLLGEKIPTLLPTPLEMMRCELTDDLLHSRLLHVTLLVPDFEGQVDLYEAANGAINQLADDLTRQAGVGIAVVWIDAVNAQGGIWVRSWGDRQLNSAAGQNILAKDYFPSSWPRPAPIPASTTGSLSTISTSGSTEAQ
jgi:hypothetical protein